MFWFLVSITGFKDIRTTLLSESGILREEPFDGPESVSGSRCIKKDRRRF
jgi:hypothetical protein